MREPERLRFDAFEFERDLDAERDLDREVLEPLLDLEVLEPLLDREVLEPLRDLERDTDLDLEPDGERVFDLKINIFVKIIQKENYNKKITWNQILI